jgi:sugar phosphate isomerase/epimerase
MKIGFANNPRKNILDEIEWIGRNGFDFVDLFLEEDQAVPEKIDIQKMRELLKTYGLGVVGHTAWYLPVGSPVPSLRDAAISEMQRYFEYFSKLTVPYVTIHANWPPGMFSTKEGIEFQVGTLRRLVESAKKHDISLMYEPVDTWHDSIESVSEIMQSVPNLYLHLDIGHAHLFGRRPEQFIETFHDKLKHIHMNDNDGRGDLHIPLGAGTIDWENVIKCLKQYYDGTITLEIFSRDRDYVLLCKEKLTKWWK